ncbi:hypothetical protein A0H81_02267 [Grifola frondosa]|uniref:Uncharacterized protein n=1 Tax=Grifola frondosa TaxID=5627 RepID=A0A1C7MN89_GRIFR|nr:hypothetical protein A0H81_02267 [Grifola frondosa]
MLEVHTNDHDTSTRLRDFWVASFADCVVKDVKTGEVLHADHLVKNVLETRLGGDKKARRLAVQPPKENARDKRCPVAARACERARADSGTGILEHAGQSRAMSTGKTVSRGTHLRERDETLGYFSARTHTAVPARDRDQPRAAALPPAHGEHCATDTWGWDAEIHTLTGWTAALKEPIVAKKLVVEFNKKDLDKRFGEEDSETAHQQPASIHQTSSSLRSASGAFRTPCSSNSCWGREQTSNAGRAPAVPMSSSKPSCAHPPLDLCTQVLSSPAVAAPAKVPIAPLGAREEFNTLVREVCELFAGVTCRHTLTCRRASSLSDDMTQGRHVLSGRTTQIHQSESAAQGTTNWVHPMV